LERVYAELEPGDALFFHSNALHRSDTNLSDQPRWALIACYNRVDNPPYKAGQRPVAEATVAEADERVIEVGRRQWDALG
jgi:ectoine hydroxylase-related dioxygenase (phytanoyl-CoA dioxygenase family)